MTISVKRDSFDTYRIIVERDELLMFCLAGSSVFSGAISASLRKIRDAIIEGEESFRSIESVVQVPPVLIIREYDGVYEIIISHPLFRDIAHRARNALAADGYYDNSVQVLSRRARSFATELRNGFIESGSILDWSSETGVAEFSSGGGIGLQDVTLRVDSVGFDLLCAVVGHYRHHVEPSAGRIGQHSDEIEAVVKDIRMLRESLLELSLRRAFTMNSLRRDDSAIYRIRPIELELSLSRARATAILNAVDRTVSSTAPSEFRALFGYSREAVQEFSHTLISAAEQEGLGLARG
jgi:hypothetical protein